MAGPKRHLTRQQKIRELAASLVPPGQSLVGAYGVMSGPPPGTEGCLGMIAFPLALVLILNRKHRVVIVTDHGLELWSTTPTGLPARCVARWPGHERLGRLQPGGNTRVEIDGTTYQVPLTSLDEARKIERLLNR